ncbi:MAG: hypothetical protein KJ621_14300, partial [Proteobacteria bacterium]|nr:hypothetical protein [Pseudomonadota bacterium]
MKLLDYVERRFGENIVFIGLLILLNIFASAFLSASFRDLLSNGIRDIFFLTDFMRALQNSFPM